MRFPIIVACLMFVSSLVLTGCGSEQSAETAQVVETAPENDVSALDDGSEFGDAPALDELLANADIKRGETMWYQCRACHSLEEGGPNKVGPNLYGMFGRKAGLAAGFAYSDALADSEIVWTPETMSDWLEQPSELIPGNRMVFVGVKDATDRANLIAFLQQKTGAE
ncbi:MAG: cytochrome c family protein [Gammaproteobacteria bacterium]|nr:cytochrome c family protein [Gammaproteobacteria bacterium]